MKLIFPEASYALQGAVFEVYREMGSGFLESVYQECLARELRIRGVPFHSKPELKLSYKGDPLLQIYKPDFICFGKIIMEIKAVKEFTAVHQAQLSTT